MKFFHKNGHFDFSPSNTHPFLEFLENVDKGCDVCDFFMVYAEDVS